MLMPQFDAQEGTKVLNPAKVYMRELHYDFTLLVENFVDPAHVPFAHHGVIGNRCAAGCFLDDLHGGVFNTCRGMLVADGSRKAAKNKGHAGVPVAPV